MTPVARRDWVSWWMAAGTAGALVLLAGAAFGQDASPAAEGKRMFTEQGCYGCHTMGKSGTPIASDLSMVGRKYSEAYLRTWLRDPKQQKPSAHMPKIALTEREANTLAAYLASLR
jgi:cytochrome c2